MRLFRRITLLTFTLFALVSCGGKKGELRIEGEITGLNNAELAVFSSDGVILGIDTIHVQGGKLSWSCPYDRETGTLTIVYPTMSTLTVFGGSGDVIHIKGDAKHLKATKVEGTQENEVYTQLREQTEEATASQRDSIIKAFIMMHPESPVTRFLQKEMMKTEQNTLLMPGALLPEFSLVTRGGDTLTTSTLKGKYCLMAFWANWRSGSTAMNSKIRRLRRQMKDSLVCISYNMDLNSSMLDYIERTDTISWHSIEDKNGFHATLPSMLELRDIPYYILADTACRIIAAGGDWKNDLEPELNSIIQSKDSLRK